MWIPPNSFLQAFLEVMPFEDCSNCCVLRALQMDLLKIYMGFSSTEFVVSVLQNYWNRSEGELIK